jgi:heme o synthase
MKTTAVSLPRLTLPSSPSLTARLGDFVTLMKPRVMLLAVFTALVGLMIAPGHLDLLHAAIAIMAIAAGGGAAGVLNMCAHSPEQLTMGNLSSKHIALGGCANGCARAAVPSTACSERWMAGAALRHI